MAAYETACRVGCPPRGLTVGAAKAAVLLYLAMAASAGAAGAQDRPGTMAVTTAADAYLLMPAELISGPVVTQMQVSPTSSNVAVLRKSLRVSVANLPTRERPMPEPPREEQELTFWNVTIRKPVALWQSAQPYTSVVLSAWMPRTESLFAVVARGIPPDGAPSAQPVAHEWKVLLLGLGIERAVAVPVPVGDYVQVNIDVSPTKPIAVLRLVAAGRAGAESLYLVHPNARLGARIDFPGAGHPAVEWNTNGEPMLVTVESADQGIRRTVLGVDARTGQTVTLPADTQTWRPETGLTTTLPIHVTTRSQALVEGDSKQRITPAWLESVTKSEYPRALLTTDSTYVRLLPDASGAVFSAHNAAWFTPLLKVNKATYLAARRAAERTVALSNAKQVGLAVVMYAQDNDEVLPGSDGIQARLSPYLRNDSLFEGFTYTYAGSRLADIASPAETVLGFAAGPGGRALLFADGHAKWVND